MIEMGKNYQTRDGRAARVLCVDRSNDSYPVVVLALDGSGYLFVTTKHGAKERGPRETDDDLIEAKPSVVFWLNARKNGDLFPYITEDLALKSATASSNYFFIARRVELPIEDGEK